MQTPLDVLFLCTGNSARSIMAEALLNDLGKLFTSLQLRSLGKVAIQGRVDDIGRVGADTVAGAS